MEETKFQSIYEDFDRVFHDKIMLSVEDICNYLGCDPQTIYNWTARKNKPPRLQIGKNVRYPKKEFVKWFLTELVRDLE